MIGQLITDTKDGKPMVNGKQLSPSRYQPSNEVVKLFARVQTDYQAAWRLQHRTFDEFDGLSLLDRAREDQRLFGTYVGVEYLPAHKKWRWRGRKNTARNKIMGILAHMLAGMLFPLVTAQNSEDEEDKMTAKVMRILVEDHLRKSRYELKFMYMLLSALVNPAVFVHVEYVTAMQRVKKRLADGTINIVEAVDELLTGISLNILPIDEIMLADFFTFDIQRQPYVPRVRRISWDEARKLYAGRYFDTNNKDLFNYVEAGKTRVVLAGQEGATLYDIEWTEADADYVQELTMYYKDEDLEVKFVGGVFMGDTEDVYNSNPFTHRRMSLVGDEWITVPVYPFAKSGFEPLDPQMRFAYYKSAAFKEYWDDKALNTMHRLALDATYLDTIKPAFISGIVKADSTVMVPGAVIPMPAGARIDSYSSGPNLKAAYEAIAQQRQDMSESTQDESQGGVQTPNVTARGVAVAQQNARIFLGNFGIMTADLVRQVGELTMDCIIQHTTVGEIDATIPESIRMRYKTIMAKSKGTGKQLTNHIVFTDANMGRDMSEEDIKQYEWNLYDKAGGYESDQRIYHVNPYKFARTKFSMYIDADEIVSVAMGTKDQRDQLAFAMMMDPRSMPFVDQKAVVDDFVIDKYGGADPDKYRNKNPPPSGAMPPGMVPPGGAPGATPGAPSPLPQPQMPALTGGYGR